MYENCFWSLFQLLKRHAFLQLCIRVIQPVKYPYFSECNLLAVGILSFFSESQKAWCKKTTWSCNIFRWGYLLPCFKRCRVMVT